MPSQYTSSETLYDAEQLARNLKIQLKEVPLSTIYQAYLTAMDDLIDNEHHGVAHENIQARIRGNILMALSNQFGWLVLTTGNKSEIAVGYCTLYGDMAGGFAVIKDVPKTLVFELSDYVNTSRGAEVIPRTVIERPPSAELRPDQKDEDSLPPIQCLTLSYMPTLKRIRPRMRSLRQDLTGESSKRLSAWSTSMNTRDARPLPG